MCRSSNLVCLNPAKQKIVLNSRELSAILACFDQFAGRGEGHPSRSIGITGVVTPGDFLLYYGLPKNLSPTNRQRIALFRTTSMKSSN